MEKPNQVNPNTAPPHEFLKYVDELEAYVNKLEKQLGLYSVSNCTKANKPKLSVKCLHCGRKFIGKIPHKCKGGYRKRKHSWQEITED